MSIAWLFVLAMAADPPAWNEVQFGDKTILLHPKVQPLPAAHLGPFVTRGDGKVLAADDERVLVSADGGRTWSEPAPLPEGILGPVKNHPIEFPDGTILCGSSTEDDGWRVHFEITPDRGLTWRRTPPINDGKAVGLIQPALLRTGAAGVVALLRSSASRVYRTGSEDGGLTWSGPEPLDLPNPNSGIDAATLRDGRHILVYNPLTEGRGVLAVALSADGKAWERVLTLEEEKGAEFSYPAVIRTRDGRVHVTYTWKRERIRHAVLDPGPRR